MNQIPRFDRFTDTQLVDVMPRLVVTECGATAVVVAGIAEFDARRLYLPASVKREVWRRDKGRCAFVAADGRKCGSASGVEFHHVQPYATGGEATVKNIEMRCRAHNGFDWTRHLDAESESLVPIR